MSTEYSISVDWLDERENWSFTGSNLMYQRAMDKLQSCRHGNKENFHCDKCEVYPDDVEDDNMPMMNYAYPLISRPTDDQIVLICNKTNCTVVENVRTGDFFLALTGGGMDLSQDIGLAYLYADERIPCALAREICTQYGLSVSGKDWVKVMRACKISLELEVECAQQRIKEIQGVLEKFRQKEKLQEVA